MISIFYKQFIFPEEGMCLILSHQWQTTQKKKKNIFFKLGYQVFFINLF